MIEEKLSNDTSSLFEPVEEEEDIDLDFDSDELGEFEGKSTMAPSTRNLLPTANKPETCCSTSKIDVNSLINYFGKVSPKAPHTFEQMCSYIQNNFTKSKEDFTGVELIPFPVNVDHFSFTLSLDVLNCLFHVATTK